MAIIAVCSASLSIRWLRMCVHEFASSEESLSCAGDTPVRRALMALATLFKVPGFSRVLFDFTWFGIITYFDFFGSLLTTRFMLLSDDYISRFRTPLFFYSSFAFSPLDFNSFGYTWYLNAFLFEHFYVYLKTLRSDKSCRALLLAGLCLLIQFF